MAGPRHRVGILQGWIADAGEPWLGTFLMELLAFPNGANDDQVDSVSQVLLWMQRFASQQVTNRILHEK
jgi:phage terminase large subunit-like protein